MPRCPVCDSSLPADRERVGARCPRCRGPLYQPPGRFPREAYAGEAVCAAHPGSASVGTCGRCGNFLCETCRTRWDRLVLCSACAERALRAGDAGPGGGVVRDRRAVWGLAGGVGAWLLMGAVAGVGFLASRAGPGDDQPVAVLAVVLVLVLMPLSVVVALVGLGQSVAALRVRGDGMILATLGLLLCGLHVGALVGLFLFEVWQI